jgi:hypothetical protein
MDWIVAVSPCAAAGGALSGRDRERCAGHVPGARRRAVALAPALIDDRHREFVAQFVALDKS